MHEYLYVPDDDSEYGPIWEEREARESFTAEQLEDALPADLVVSLDGSRGHYLAAAFLAEGAILLEEATVGSGTAVDLSLPEHRELRDRIADLIPEAMTTSDTYDAHQGLFSGVDACEPMCERCEFIHDDCDAVEAALSDLGYVTTWNDGVTIHRVYGEES